MQRLSTLDAGFLRAESANAHMHVGWLALLDLPAGADALDAPALRAAIAGRLRLVPRFRQLVRDPGLPIGEAAWVDAAAFDLDEHLVVESSGGALGPEEVGARADAFLSRPLDRSRPLWELLVLPRVHGGRAALIGKVHHAMVDGIAAVELGLLLFDVEVETAPLAPSPWSPAPLAGEVRAAVGAVADEAVAQMRALRGVARKGLAPRQTARIAGTLRRAALSLAEGTLAPAPRSCLNADIGPRRTLHVTRLELARLEAIKRETGAKLNDVVLCVVAGALRRFAGLHGDPGARLRAMVPVNLRPDGTAGEGGNRIGFGLVDLPTDVPGPADRLREVRREMAELKGSGRVDGTDLLIRSLAPLPGPIKDRAVRLASSPRLYNLAVSNVPGPRMPLYVGGARVAEIHPVIPIPDGHALSIGVLTYDGGLHVAVYADPEALRAAGLLCDLVAAATRELERAVLGTTARPRGPARRRRAGSPHRIVRELRAVSQTG